MKGENFSRLLKLAALAGVLVVGSVLTYYGSTQNKFVWDTYQYLFQHPFYLSSIDIDHLLWMLTCLDNSNWHPLTWLSWAIDYQIYGGLNTWGYHLTNIVLHALNGAALFFVILTLLGVNQPAERGFRIRTDNPAMVAAFLAAALFAVHPQHVESVAWVAERKDVLCQLFMLLSILAYIRFVCCGVPAKNRWFNASLFLFFLAVLSKPMAVTLPVVLLLLDIYPLRRSQLIAPLNPSMPQQTYYGLMREKLPFFLLSIVLVLMTLKAQEHSIIEVPLVDRTLNTFHSIVFYLEKLVAPTSLSPHYPFFPRPGDALTWVAFVPVLVFCAITLLCLVAWRRKHPAWLIAWLFYLVTLSPVLGIIQVGEQGAADRYAYFPTLPAYVLAGAGLAWLFERLRTAARTLVVVAALCIIGLLAARTVAQIQVWRTSLSLWQHAVKYSPDSGLAQFNLGITYMNHDDFEGAARHLEIADRLARNPGRELAWRAFVYLKLGRYQDALDAHTKLSRIEQSRPELPIRRDCVQFNLGWLNARLEQPEVARRHFNAVGADSKLSHDAGVWLDWLNRRSESGSASAADESELPGFCPGLLPALGGNAWVNMLNEAKSGTASPPGMR